ncbi:hypothetical protein [Leptospira bandrabouensis]|uniref:hypothetical protein n=1 Tax=Leptospira bandrabouensis TaxID=2484903 RepID=UPI001EE94CFB|nr:hypothetical protein [Leptospira bandrabouensis]MCG6146591.1 hypothetical protein [Leptospira bandrabouensis]MCG6161966.1 hypothetical protein [Leptospira bandrabouensis]MCG6166178.1 hypothetical protein [Leptospira bandrabouensis]
MNKNKEKGNILEESIRHFFLSEGFYVVRGIILSIDTDTITDIDLLLFKKISPLVRNKANVDIRNRKRPQTFERMLWTSGIKSLLGYDNCYLVSTEARPSMFRFAKNHGISLIAEPLTSYIENKYKKENLRLSEEEFCEKIRLISEQDQKEITSFKIYTYCREILPHEFNFDNLNQILNQIKEIFNLYIIQNKSENTVRVLYLTVSFFLLILDFILKDFYSLGKDDSSKQLSSIIRFGNNGKKQSELMLNRMTKLFNTISNSVQPELFDTVREKANDQWNKIPAEIISDFYTQEIHKNAIFDYAITFENLAYSTNLKTLSELTPNQKSILYNLCDFLNIDRKKM